MSANVYRYEWKQVAARLTNLKSYQSKIVHLLKSFNVQTHSGGVP